MFIQVCSLRSCWDASGRDLSLSRELVFARKRFYQNHSLEWNTVNIFRPSQWLSHVNLVLIQCFFTLMMHKWVSSFVQASHCWLTGSAGNTGDVPFKGGGRLLPAQKSLPQQPPRSRCCPNRPLYAVPNWPHGEYTEGFLGFRKENDYCNSLLYV